MMGEEPGPRKYFPLNTPLPPPGRAGVWAGRLGKTTPIKFQQVQIQLPDPLYQRLKAISAEGDWDGWIAFFLQAIVTQAGQNSARVSAIQALYEEMKLAIQMEWDCPFNWKVLTENFMESYHLPMCHAGTIGGASKLDEMICPEGTDAFNYHWILKNDTVPLALAHPTNTTLQGDERRKTWLIAIYPSLLITLTPGYFWYLSLTPDGPGRVNVMFGGGLSADWMADPDAAAHLAKVKALLDDVNVEDKGCTEKVYTGLLSEIGEPGPLSHLERPNFEFAQYLARRIPA